MKQLILFNIMAIILLALNVSGAELIHYNFSDLNDYSGNGYDITNPGNGATSVSDYPTFLIGNSSPNSFSFDGVNDYLYYSGTISGVKSFGGWFKLTNDVVLETNAEILFHAKTTDVYNTIWLGSIGGFSTTEMISIVTGGNINYWWSNSDVGFDTYNSDEWYHWFFVWTGSTYELFINGDSKGTARNQGSPVEQSTWTNDFQLGKRTYTTNSFFNGLMDEFRVYDNSLTAKEVENLYVCNSILNCSIEYLDYTTGVPSLVGMGNVYNDLDGLNDGDLVHSADSSIYSVDANINDYILLTFDKNYTITRIGASNVDDGHGGSYPFDFDILVDDTVVYSGKFLGVTPLNFNESIIFPVEGSTLKFKITNDYTGDDRLLIAELYAYGYVSNITEVGNVAPNITLISPENNDHYGIENLNLIFNVSDVDDEIVNCSFYISETLGGTTSINLSETNTHTFQTNTIEGSSTWKISCTDGEDITTSETRTIIRDLTKPIWTINTINTSNTTIYNLYNETNITFNDTLTDTYLFAYNISILYPNSSLYYENSTIGLLSEIENFNYNISIPETIGLYTINYYAEDDHTLNEIPDYEYNILSDGYFFAFNNYYINVKSENPSSLQALNTTKLIDRYTFDIEYKSPAKIRTYSLKSNTKIYYREGLYDFPSFVIGKNWVDFNILDNDVVYNVIKKDEYWYQIEIETLNPSTTQNIKSLGGLNFANETYTFEVINNTPPETSPEITPTLVDSNTLMRCEPNGFDINNDTLTYQYLWYENENIQPFTEYEIQSENITAGQIWICSVRAYDGRVFGLYTNSSEKIVQIGGSVVNVDLTPISEGIKMIFLLLIFLMIVFMGIFFRNTSWLIFSGIYLFVFSLTLDIDPLMKIIAIIFSTAYTLSFVRKYASEK